MSQPLLQRGSLRATYGPPVGLFVFSVLLRLFGILWGGAHPDENFNQAVKALSGQLVPDSHYYPPLLGYLDALAYGCMAVIGWCLGIYTGPADVRAQWFDNPLPFILVGRCVVAVLASCAAPAAWALARRLGASRAIAVGAGLSVAMLPVSVLYSRISKPDAALAAAVTVFFAVSVAAIQAFETRKPNRWACLLVGVSAGVALSFKQTALFYCGPIGAFVAWSAIRCPGSPKERAGRVLALALAGAATWSIANIGVLLDLGNFLEYQIVQSQMSHRFTGFGTMAAAAGDRLGSLSLGASWLGVAAWVGLPFVWRNRHFMMWWGATLIGMGVTAVIAGERVTETLLMTAAAQMVAMVIVGYGLGARQRGGAMRIVLGAVPAAMLATLAWGTAEVLREVRREPMSRRVSQLIESHNPDGSLRVLTGDRRLIDLRRSIESIRDEDARDERLAQKYGVKLPSRAPERRRDAGGGRSYYIREIPYAIGGLEVYDEAHIKVVKAFAWPIQREEFSLSWYEKDGPWLIVIAADGDKSRVEAYRNLYVEIRDRCQLIARLPPRRPLLWEVPIEVYSFDPVARNGATGRGPDAGQGSTTGAPAAPLPPGR